MKIVLSMDEVEEFIIEGMKRKTGWKVTFLSILDTECGEDVSTEIEFVLGTEREPTPA